MKPSRQDPVDPDPLCIFENPAADTQPERVISTAPQGVRVHVKK